MTRFITALLTITLLAACGGSEASAPDDAVTTTVSASTSITDPPGDPALSEFPEAEGLVYGTNGSVEYVTIPATECTYVTSSPIVVDEMLVWSIHDRGHGCEPRDALSATLLGYDLSTGTLHVLAEGYTGEATPALVEAEGLLFWNTTFGGAVQVLDPATFEVIATNEELSVVSDSSGVYLDGTFYFGTINTPEDNCQDPIKETCGGLYGMTSDGTIVARLATEGGFRSWVAAGITTDGEYLYVGGGPQHLGDSDDEYLYGCSVVKLDASLEVVASFDPGDEGCHRTGAGNADEDAVAGEIVISMDGTLWVQFAHAVDDRNTYALFHLDENLEEMCAFEVEVGPLMAAGYYQGVTIDAEGNAYVSITVPDGARRTAELWKVTPDCTGTLLDTAPGQGTSTPVLADDSVVLFAVSGELRVVSTEGELVAAYELGTDAPVVSSPVIVDGSIFVVATDGTVSVISDAGLEGYGDAWWPRFRHDDSGSGAVNLAG